MNCCNCGKLVTSVKVIVTEEVEYTVTPIINASGKHDAEWSTGEIIESSETKATYQCTKCDYCFGSWNVYRHPLKEDVMIQLFSEDDAELWKWVNSPPGEGTVKGGQEALETAIKAVRGEDNKETVDK